MLMYIYVSNHKTHDYTGIMLHSHHGTRKKKKAEGKKKNDSVYLSWGCILKTAKNLTLKVIFPACCNGWGAKVGGLEPPKGSFSLTSWSLTHISADKGCCNIGVCTLEKFLHGVGTWSWKKSCTPHWDDSKSQRSRRCSSRTNALATRWLMLA